MFSGSRTCFIFVASGSFSYLLLWTSGGLIREGFPGRLSDTVVAALRPPVRAVGTIAGFACSVVSVFWWCGPLFYVRMLVLSKSVLPGGCLFFSGGPAHYPLGCVMNKISMCKLWKLGRRWKLPWIRC